MQTDLKKLINIAEEKLEMLHALYEVTVKIGTAISSNNLDELKNMLEAKQKIIENIDKLDLDFLPLYNDFKKENRVSSIFDIVNEGISQNVSILKGIFIKIKSLLEKIKEKDDKNTHDISLMLMKTENKLDELSKSKIGYLEYMKYYTPNSYFIDKKR